LLVSAKILSCPVDVETFNSLNPISANTYYRNLLGYEKLLRKVV